MCGDEQVRLIEPHAEVHREAFADPDAVLEEERPLRPTDPVGESKRTISCELSRLVADLRVFCSFRIGDRKGESLSEVETGHFTTGFDRMTLAVQGGHRTNAETVLLPVGLRRDRGVAGTREQR